MKNSYILITGSNSGIGLSLAQLASRDSKKIILHGRDVQKLEAVASEFRANGISVESVALDLSKPGSAQHLFNYIEQQGWEVSELINNAGFGSFGRFDEIEMQHQTEMQQLNMISLTELCHLFGKKMIERGGGKILNIASTAAFQPGPFMNVYCATKAYVLHFSEALHYEWSPLGVTVTTLCPGPTDTGFVANANLTGSELASGKIMKWVPVGPVAQLGYDAMKHGKMTVIHGSLNNFATFLTRFLPRKTIVNITAQLMGKAKK
jgi:hypothetical protein